MRKTLYLLIFLCTGFQMKSQTVFDIIATSPNHTTLATAVVAAGLDVALSGPGPFTVFAPTDAAFEALPPTVISDLLSDPQGALTDVLLYHVLDSQVLSTELVDGMMVTTLQGEEITVTINGSDVFINDAQVTFPDMQGTNGVVHVIDAVLLPPVMPTNTIMDIVTNSADHNTLEIALNASSLNETLGNPGDFTLFAPTDAAFALLPAGTVDDLLADPTGALLNVLLYHALSGTVVSSMLSDGMMATTIQGSDITVTINADGVFINNARVTTADIMATNGVVHVIDAVLLPPPPPTNTILDIIVNSPVHTTLETAVNAAGLADDLSGTGPFTVFAPTDAAFSALPATLIAQLLADPTGQLAQILLYHVVAAEAPSSSLSNGQIITTLQGEDVTVTINAEGVFINDAQVTTVDIMADNGIVHVIDAVLSPPPPPTNTILDIIVNSPDHNTLELAVNAAGLADDLSGTGPFTVFAPTDAAFSALPPALITELLADPTGQLAQILLYHVVAGEAPSSSLSNGQTVTTLQGDDVTVSITNGSVFINDAQVIVADIMADNGIVHVINAVLTLSSSVNESNMQSALVYPNPATEMLNVNMTGVMGSTQFEIYSVTGKLMSTGSLNGMTNSISLETLSQGMYQLKLTNGAECVSHSFMKN